MDFRFQLAEVENKNYQQLSGIDPSLSYHSLVLNTTLSKVEQQP
jgi:hypothetical protein